MSQTEVIDESDLTDNLSITGWVSGSISLILLCISIVLGISEEFEIMGFVLGVFFIFALITSMIFVIKFKLNEVLAASYHRYLLYWGIALSVFGVIAFITAGLAVMVGSKIGALILAAVGTALCSFGSSMLWVNFDLERLKEDQTIQADWFIASVFSSITAALALLVAIGVGIGLKGKFWLGVVGVIFLFGIWLPISWVQAYNVD